MSAVPGCVDDEITERLFAPPPDASQASARFQHFVTAVLSGKAREKLRKEHLLVACLIAFDAIPSSLALLSCLERRAQWQNTRKGIFASWSDEGVLHRRQLSAFTAIIARETKDLVINWKKVLPDFNSSLSVLYDFGESVSIHERTDRLIADSVSWLCLRVPPSLGAHVVGLLHITALPDHIWDRQFSRPVAISRSLGEALDPGDTGEQEQIILQRVVEVSQSRSATLTGSWFVRALKAAFKGCAGPGVDLSNTRARQRLIDQLNPLSRQLSDAGLHEVLLLGWLLDLLRHGSARKKKPAIRTIYLYIGAAAELIQTALRAMSADPLEAEPPKWSAFYEGILASANQRETVAPALASFHRFMVRNFDVEPLLNIFGPLAAEAVPGASMVWPEDFREAYEMIERLSTDARATEQTKIWLILLQHTSIRREELLGLRVRSVSSYDQTLLIEVVPRRGHKNLKSAASHRSIIITDKQATEVIIAWRERREKEGAELDDHLFGDPYSAGLYKAALCYCLLSQALKQVTQDPEVCIHSCRHAYVSREVLASHAPSSGVQGISRLDQVRVQTGHRSLTTTLLTYAHLYESSLRAWTDAELMPLISSQVMAIWTGDSAASWRKRKERKAVGAETYLEALNASCLRTSDDGAGHAAPMRIVVSAPRVGPCSLATVVRVAIDIADARSESSICSRAGVTPDDVRCVAMGVVQITRSFLSRHVATITASESSFSDARPALVTYGFDTGRLHWECWTRFLDCASKLGQPQRQLLVRTWRQSHCRGLLSLEDPHALRPVLELLRVSGFPAGKLRMRAIQGDPSNIAEHARCESIIASAKTLFKDVFSENVELERVSPRRGRPDHYLLPLTSFPSRAGVTPPALIDAKSLDAAMLCVAVFDFWHSNYKDGNGS